MRAVVLHHHNPHVAHVEARDFGGERKDVAIPQVLLAPLAHQHRAADVRETVRAVAYLAVFHTLVFRRVLQGRIFIAMRCHIVEGLHGIGHIRHTPCHLLYVPPMGVVDNPVADIVQPRAISVDASLAVAYLPEVIDEILPCAAPLLYREGHRKHCLDKGGAVESVEIYGELFGRALEGSGRIGGVDKSFCD